MRLLMMQSPGARVRSYDRDLLARECDATAAGDSGAGRGQCDESDLPLSMPSMVFDEP